MDEKEKQEKFSKTRKEAIESLKRMRDNDLNDADVHDAIFVHWSDYFNESRKEALNLAGRKCIKDCAEITNGMSAEFDAELAEKNEEIATLKAEHEKEKTTTYNDGLTEGRRQERQAIRKRIDERILHYKKRMGTSTRSKPEWGHTKIELELLTEYLKETEK